MASFRIWSRVTPIGQDQYLAMVAALPERGVGDGRHEAETRLLSSLKQAQKARVEMLGAMQQRLVKRGDTVLDGLPVA